MSHSVKITLIADQEIQLLGDVVNIHDLECIHLGSHGGIVSYSKRTQQTSVVDRATDTEVCMFCEDPKCKNAECEDDY